jgi:hypothetical protein
MKTYEQIVEENRQLRYALIDAVEELQALIIKRDLGAMDVGAAVQTVARSIKVLGEGGGLVK